MNRLTVIGTEANDRYVVQGEIMPCQTLSVHFIFPFPVNSQLLYFYFPQDGAIFGGGLSIKFTNIAYLDAEGQEGNDEFVILSTNPSVLLSLYGGLGSDSFEIAPRTVGPVISKNLRGGLD